MRKNVWRNPKPNGKKKYKEHLKTLILSITETNDLLSDHMEMNVIHY